MTAKILYLRKIFKMLEDKVTEGEIMPELLEIKKVYAVTMQIYSNH